ncbi:hypothetical protein F4779DRAFT_577414 [Xylariaceae sp. FL0662B]|nr:hypothetical protein F4779DRAFT_577414 [Xylariaceae sp. FL0662B]
MRLSGILSVLEILALGVATNGAPTQAEDGSSIARRWPGMTPGEALWIILIANERDAMRPEPDLNDRKAFLRASQRAQMKVSGDDWMDWDEALSAHSHTYFPDGGLVREAVRKHNNT